MYDLNNRFELILFIISILSIVAVILYNIRKYYKGEKVNIFEILAQIFFAYLTGPALVSIILILLIFESGFGNIQKKP